MNGIVELAGRPALLVFFKTSCATCDLTFPYIKRLRDEYPEGWDLWARISQGSEAPALPHGRATDTFSFCVPASGREIFS